MLDKRTAGSIFALLACLVCLFAAFVGPVAAAEPWGWGGEKPDVSDKREWTVLIYYDGDNDLERYALLDIKEVEKGFSGNGKAEVIMLLDRAKDYDESMGNWTEARVYRAKKSVRDGEIDSELIANMGELNMGDPSTLESFIRASVKRYPAKRVALVMWNHGGGWASMAVDQDAPGTENGVDELNIKELRDVLAKTAPLLDGGKFEMINFDMCLMGQVEVVAACAPFVKYITAGTTVIPAVGMDYLGAVPLFEGGLDTAEIAKKMVALGCKGFSEIGNETSSLSAYDASKAGDLEAAFKKFADKLRSIAPKVWRDVTRTVFFSKNYGGIGDYDRGKGALSSIDLLDWLARLRKMPAGAELNREIDALERAAKAAIIASETGRAIAGLSHGMAFYSPLRADNVNPNYAETDFDMATGWSAALAQIHNAQLKQGMQKPRITSIEMGQAVLKKGVKTPRGGFDIDIKPLDAVMSMSNNNPGNESWVKFTIEGENILWAYGAFAFSNSSDGEYIFCIQQIMSDERFNANSERTEIFTPVFKDGKNELAYQMSGIMHMFDNGTESTLIYPRFVDVNDIKHFTVSGKYRDSRLGTDVSVEVKVSLEFGYVASITAFAEDDNGNIVTSMIDPQADGVFTPLLTIFKNGKVADVPGKGIKWKDGFSLVFEPIPAGSWIKAFALAESLGGAGEISVSKAYKVIENPKISPFIEGTQKNVLSKLIGRYASLSSVQKRATDELVTAPNGAVIEIALQDDMNIMTLSNFGEAPMKLRLLVQEKGLPIFRLIDYSGGAPVLVKNDYALFVEEQGRYSFRLLDANNSAVTTLIPLDDAWFPKGYLSGEWFGDDGSKFSFEGSRVAYSEGQRNWRGSYTLSDNIAKVSRESGGDIALFTAYEPDRRMLVVTFSDTETAMLYHRKGVEQPAPTPTPTPVPTPAPAPMPIPAPQTVSLDGVWGTMLNGNQIVMQIQGNQYQMWMNGVLSEYGVFQIQRNMIYGQSNASQFANQFELGQGGAWFRMRLQNGMVITYQRMQ